MNKSESKYLNTAIKMDMALMDLLKKKPFEFVTVSELCKKAGVNRSTFYLHYDTMADLLNETAKFLLDSFWQCFADEKEKTKPISIETCKEIELNFICEKYLTPYLTYISNNREIFVVALQNAKLLGFEKVYGNMFEKVFDPVLNRFGFVPEDRKYVMLYYVNGINAIVVQWLNDDCQKSTDEIIGIIKMCVFGKDGNTDISTANV